MTTKPQIGRNLYNDAIQRVKAGTQVSRECLRRILNESPGPQTLAMLVAKIAVEIGHIEAAVNDLDEIGRNAKTLKKGE